MNPLRRHFVLAFFLLSPAIAIAEQQPNVLWLLTDDQRYDSISAFNQLLHNRGHSELGYVESPNVDRLAKMGTTFINAYCHAPGCAPSRASMHLGRYPFRSGIYEFEYHNNNAEHCQPTLPEQMAKLGYQTLHIGKLGVRIRTLKNDWTEPHPIYQTDIDSKLLAKEGLADWGKNWFYEFDGKKLDEPLKDIEFFITPAGEFEYTNPVLESMPGYEGQSKRVDEKYQLLRHFNTKKRKAYGMGMALAGVSPRAAGKTRDGYYSSVLVDYLNNPNRKFAVGSKDFQGVDPSKPLFCHIGFDFPHTPVIPPIEFRDRFKQKTYKVPAFDESELKGMATQQRQQVTIGYSDHLTDDQKQTMIQDYYAFCAYGDSLIGQAADAFIRYSEHLGQPWVIAYVCGDHGWKLNDHGSVSKFSSWDVDCHNPIIVVASDKTAFPAGKVVIDFAEFVDIAPTILSAGGADLDEERFAYLDGYDMAKVASGDVATRDYVVGESHAVTGPRAWIRTKQYVLSLQTRPDKRRGKDMEWALNATYEELDPALYHMPSDPHELNNLAFDEAHRQIAKVLKEKLLQIVIGGRVEVDWGTKGEGTEVFRSSVPAGAHDGKLNLPPPADWSHRVTLPDEEQPIDLFNGDNLDGWEGLDKYFSVVNGAIRARNDEPVKMSTFLFTKQELRNYRLLLEVKQTMGKEYSTMHSAVASVGEHVTDWGGEYGFKGPILMFCHDWGVWGADGRQRLFPPDQKVPMSNVPWEKKGAWNQLELLVVGDRMRMVANGQLVVDYTETARELKRCAIGLQMHNEKRTQEFHFRGLVAVDNPSDVLLTQTSSVLTSDDG